MPDDKKVASPANLPAPDFDSPDVTPDTKGAPDDKTTKDDAPGSLKDFLSAAKADTVDPSPDAQERLAKQRQAQDKEIAKEHESITGGLLKAIQKDQGDPPDSGDPEPKSDDLESKSIEAVDVELPPSASRNASEAFNKIKANRDEFRSENERLRKQLEEVEQKPQGISQDEFDKLKSEYEKYKADLEAASHERDQYREKVEILDLTQNPRFQAEYDEKIARMEKDSVELMNLAGEEAEGLKAMAVSAVRATDDTQFYRMANELVESLPDYVRLPLVQNLKNIRELAVDREAAIKDYATKAEEYKAREMEANKAGVKDFGQRFEKLGHQVAQNEEALNAYKSEPHVQEVIKEIADKQEQFRAGAVQALEQQIEKFGGVTDEVAVLAHHGIKRFEDVAMMRQIASAFENLRSQHEELRANYEKVTGKKASGASPSATPREGAPSKENSEVKSLVEFGREKGIIS